MRSRCILSKFYIKPQHGRTCFGYNRVVSYRNSTSNHNILTLRSGSIMLYLIEILHQTTTTPVASGDFSSCILSKFYIKPQHFDFEKRINYVVSYRNSTSNHNFIDALSARARLYLIEILHQTTTLRVVVILRNKLYLIEILHQTTTAAISFGSSVLLYLIEILHQTTTPVAPPLVPAVLYLIEILHQTTTYIADGRHEGLLYLIEILHQTTTPP